MAVVRVQPADGKVSSTPHTCLICPLRAPNKSTFRTCRPGRTCILWLEIGKSLSISNKHDNPSFSLCPCDRAGSKLVACVAALWKRSSKTMMGPSTEVRWYHTAHCTQRTVRATFPNASSTVADLFSQSKLPVSTVLIVPPPRKEGSRNREGHCMLRAIRFLLTFRPDDHKRRAQL